MTNVTRLNKEKDKDGFHVTDGTGIVRNIVGEWEKLFVQNSSTVECVNLCIRAAQLRIRQIGAGSSFLPDLDMTKPQLFPIGSTHVYPLNTLVDSATYMALEQIIKGDLGRPKVLSSGVYSMSESGKPLIETTAVVMIPEDAGGSVWVALTVNVAEGISIDDPAVLGVHKVAVFFANDKDAISEKSGLEMASSGASGASRVLTSKKLLERELQIVRDDEDLKYQQSAEEERLKKLIEEEHRHAEIMHKVEEMRKLKENLERAKHEAEEAAVRMKNPTTTNNTPSLIATKQAPAFDTNGDTLLSHADTYLVSEKVGTLVEQTNPMSLSLEVKRRDSSSNVVTSGTVDADAATSLGQLVFTGQYREGMEVWAYSGIDLSRLSRFTGKTASGRSVIPTGRKQNNMEVWAYSDDLAKLPEEWNISSVLASLASTPIL